MPHRLRIMITLTIDVEVDTNEPQVVDVETVPTSSEPATQPGPRLPTVHRPPCFEEVRDGR